jgi:protocatechuate 3,4-dioxygenase beta subunit
MKNNRIVFPRLTGGSFCRAVLFVLLGLFSFSSLLAEEEEGPLEITDVLLSNHTGTACVISWRTNTSTAVNQVVYGTDKDNLDLTVVDTVSKMHGPNRTHYAQLIWLTPGTKYYYRAISEDVESELDSVVASSQADVRTRVYLSGRVTDQTNTPLENVLVRSFIKWSADSSMWFTLLTLPDGSFSFSYANYRLYNGSGVSYEANQRTIHLHFLGAVQGSLKDSVLLTEEMGPTGAYQDLGTYELIDAAKKAMRGRIHTTSPVRANGYSASVVTVTILDDEDNPVPDVELEIRPSGGGNIVTGPFSLTDDNGTAVGLVRSQVAQVKNIEIYNLTADSLGTAKIDTVGQIDFVGSLTDISQDSVAPLILSTTELENTEDNVGPYRVTSKIIDNFNFKAKLIFSTAGNLFTDTLDMSRVSSALPTEDNPDADLFYADIQGQAFNTKVKYFVLAVDTAGHAVTYPSGILTDPFAIPIDFEIKREGEDPAAVMGINPTTDALSINNPDLSVRIDTRIISTAGISSAVIKWRNIVETESFNDISMTNFGAHYWGYIPASQRGSRIEYFIQAVDSLGRLEKDRRDAPDQGLFNYDVMSLDPTIDFTFADTTDEIGTDDVRKTRHSIMADLNNDGYPDLVSANYGEKNSVYFYSPNARMLGEVTDNAFPNQLAEKTTHVVAADIDADDDLDLIFANEGQQNRLYLNNGNGGFDDVTSLTFSEGSGTRMPDDTWSSTCVLADDFDGDGDIDLFFANDALTGQQNRLLRNDSLGVFRDFTANSGLTNVPVDKSIWALTGDMDGDKDPDILVINRAQSHILLVNNGKGIFTVGTVAAGSASQARGADLGDVDGDGDLDLIIAQTQTQQNELYINNGQGQFTQETSSRLPVESDDTRGVKFFDANADGYLDLYCINYGQNNRLLFNDGLGSFFAAQSGIIPIWESYSTAVTIGDLNQDNQPDLYISEEDRKNTLIFSRTMSMDLEDLPSHFDLISPEENDTINTLEATFVWHSSHAVDTTDIINYTFRLSLDSLFTPEMQVAQQQVADTTVTIQNLTDETTYWWKVSAENSLGIPITSNQIFKLTVQESYTGSEPEFLVLVNRNPVFTSFMNVYIVSSEELDGDPVVNINLEPVSVKKLTGSNIWIAQYQTSTGFLLTVQGTNMWGKTVEKTVTLSSALASAGETTMLMAADGKAWLTLSAGSGAEEQVLFVQSHQKTTSEQLKASARDLVAGGDISSEDLAVILDGDCYSFTSLDKKLKRSALVSIKGDRNLAGDGSVAVCILDNGVWVPLPTSYNNRTGAFTSVTDRLGTYALRSVNISIELQLPRAFALSQNSPNPFNPSTQISYSVPDQGSESKVRINVYNLRGALVQVLVDVRQLPGTYAVEWNGRDREGRDLPSGIYFYRLESSEMVITRKMVLIR